MCTVLYSIPNINFPTANPQEINRIIRKIRSRGSRILSFSLWTMSRRLIAFMLVHERINEIPVVIVVDADINSCSNYSLVIPIECECKLSEFVATIAEKNKISNSSTFPALLTSFTLLLH